MRTKTILIIGGILMTTILVKMSRGQQEQSLSKEVEAMTMYPIGRVHKTDAETTIEIDPRFEEALLGLEGFSHMWVIWWFHRNDSPDKRSILKVHPRGDSTNPLTGVFATRSPVRPNLIGMTLCGIRSLDGNVVTIDDIDAFDDTPVVDLKPYIPRNDDTAEARVPSWVHEKQE